MQGLGRAASVKAAEKLGSTNIKDQHSLWGRLLACLAYAFMSISITLFNKAVFSVYKFPFPAFVTTLQISVSIVYMLALHYARFMDLGTSWSFKTAKQVFPLSLAWWLYVVSGVTALRYLNVPMYSVFRRSTTLLVAAGEWVMFQKKPSGLSMVSIFVMVSGAIVAGATDLSYSLPGYIWVAICAVSTAVYLLLIRKLSDKTGLKQSGLLYYNNMLSLPLMAAYMLLCTNEFQEALRMPQLQDPQFLIVLIFSASQAYLLNVCIFWCTTTNSALTTTVTGQMKDLATTGLGMVMFGDVSFNGKNILGVSVGMSGAMLYSFLSYWERNNVRSQ